MKYLKNNCDLDTCTRSIYILISNTNISFSYFAKLYYILMSLFLSLPLSLLLSSLLQESRLFIGLGFPYEGTTPFITVL